MQRKRDELQRKKAIEQAEKSAIEEEEKAKKKNVQATAMLMKAQKLLADFWKLEEESAKERRVIRKDRSSIVGCLLRQKAKQMTLLTLKKSQVEKHKLMLSNDRLLPF